MDFISIVVLLVSVTGGLSIEDSPLTSVAEWKNLDYQLDAVSKAAAINSGKWIAENQILIDVGVYYRNGVAKKFVTIPRFLKGVPVTLGIISDIRSSNGPLIIPYPNYSWHSSHGANCDDLTSVFRVAIDKLHRLWVLDTGMVDGVQLCKPQILIFDLRTDTLIRRYRIPTNQYNSGISIFVTIVVDVRDQTGIDTMAYLADIKGFGIVMYSFKNNNSWRAQNSLLSADPNYRKFNISGESFDLMDGFIAMAVSLPIGSRLASIYSTFDVPLAANDRFLFFHALTTGSECAVPLRFLDNKVLWDANVNSVPRAFIQLGTRLVQSPAEVMDSNGNLFFSLTTPNAIACWDPNQPYSKPYINLVAQSDLKLQYASGLKIVTNPYGKEELWTVTCRFQKIMTGSMNFAEVNFRIQSSLVSTLLKEHKMCSEL